MDKLVHQTIIGSGNQAQREAKTEVRQQMGKIVHQNKDISGQQALMKKNRIDIRQQMDKLLHQTSLRSAKHAQME